MSSKPYLINSEPTNYCCFKCPFCPTGKRNSRQNGFAQVSSYEKVFEQMAKYTYIVTIHGWGEPTMNKNLPKIIQLANRNRICSVVTTNGYLLTREMSQKIISSKLDYLIFSIDGISEESYQKYRIGGSLEVVLNNLKNLILLRKEADSPTPFIEWQFLVFKHNEHEIHLAKKMATEIGVDNIVFMPAYTEDSDYDASDENYRLPKLSPLIKRTDCKHLWSTFSFHWNGNIVPCCYDYDGKVEYGNILTEKFDQIWNNQQFIESRKIIKNGYENYSSEIYCSNCVRNIQ